MGRGGMGMGMGRGNGNGGGKGGMGMGMGRGNGNGDGKGGGILTVLLRPMSGPAYGDTWMHVTFYFHFQGCHLFFVRAILMI